MKDMLGDAKYALLLLCFCAVLPAFLTNGQLGLMTDYYTLLVLAIMWNLLAGYANMVTVGQHAFVGVGCYSFYAFAALLRFDPYVSIVLAALTALLLAVPVLAIVFRMRDAYFAVGTWVVAEVLMLVAGKLPMFGGGSGVSVPAAVVRQIGVSASERAQTYYWLGLSLAVLAFLAAYLLLRSRLGVGLRAMRDDEAGAGSAGVNVIATRMTCFLLTAPFLGAAGALVVLQKLRISPAASFSMVDWTVYVTFIVVIGGLGTLEGAFIGAALFFVLRELFSDLGTWHLIILGCLSIVVILIEPRGIWGRINASGHYGIFPLSRLNRTAQTPNV
jgi:branched-chain amino acid transport system permease protein